LGEATLSIEVRELAAPDIGTVSEIFDWYAANSLATFTEAPRPESEWRDLRSVLTDLGLPFLVAETAGIIAGYAYACPWRQKSAYRHTVEDSIYVAPDMTGRGIGRQLLTRLLAASAEAGARQMVAVIADTGEDSSVRLHETHGFRHAGRLSGVGYKHGRWVDTLFMQRSLT
jgi:L-amino acid N-acyltransferase YncA